MNVGQEGGRGRKREEEREREREREGKRKGAFTLLERCSEERMRRKV